MSARPSTRLFAPRSLALVVASLVVACIYWAPAFRDPRSLGFGDWEYFHHMWEVGLAAWRRHGEPALWDPFQCGGVPMWGDPQAQIYGPWFLLAFPLGSTLALKVGVVLHTAVAISTGYLYARRVHGASTLGGALAAAVFAGSGFFASHLGGGHAAFAPFLLFPALLLAYHRACGDARFIAAVALLLALILFEGGVYPLPYAVLLVAFEATARALGTRRVRESVVPAIAGGLLFVPLAAARLAPIVVELGRHPRPTADHDHLGIDDLVTMLTARGHAPTFPGHAWVWAEYMTYVGWGVLLLAFVGYHRAFVVRRPHAALGALLFFGLSCGELGPWSPWSLLHHVPVFDSLRVPSRFAVVGVLFAAVLAGLSLDALVRIVARRTGARRFAAALGLVLAIACAVDIFVSTRPEVDRWHGEPLPAFVERPDYHLRADGPFSRRLVEGPARGEGTRGCYVVLAYEVARTLEVGRVPQARLTGPGRVLSVTPTVDTVTVELDADAPTTLIVNQNFAPDWTSSLGAPRDVSGRLGLDVPAGRRRVSFRYRPSTFVPSTVTSVVALLATLAAVVAASVRRRRAAA